MSYLNYVEIDMWCHSYHDQQSPIISLYIHLLSNSCRTNVDDCEWMFPYNLQTSWIDIQYLDRVRHNHNELDTSHQVQYEHQWPANEQAHLIIDWSIVCVSKSTTEFQHLKITQTEIIILQISSKNNEYCLVEQIWCIKNFPWQNGENISWKKLDWLRADQVLHRTWFDWYSALDFAMKKSKSLLLEKKQFFYTRWNRVTSISPAFGGVRGLWYSIDITLILRSPHHDYTDAVADHFLHSISVQPWSILTLMSADSLNKIVGDKSYEI